jgi:Ca2+-binding RTX toxin-like protein
LANFIVAIGPIATEEFDGQQPVGTAITFTAKTPGTPLPELKFSAVPGSLPIFATTTENREELEATGVVTVNNIATLNIISGEGTNAPNAINLVTDSATTLNITGESDLTIMGRVSDSVNLIDATGLSGDLYVAVATGDNTVLGGSGNDIIVGAVEADLVDGGNGNDTILSGGGDDSLEGGEGDDLLIITDGSVLQVSIGSLVLPNSPPPPNVPAGSAVFVSGGDGNDVIDFSVGSLAANDSNNQADNDTIDGGDGVDTLIARSADLLAIDNTLKGAVQTVSGIEAITISDNLDGGDGDDDEDVTLTLSKIQSGIQTVTLAGEAIVDENGNTVEDGGNDDFGIVYDSGVAGILNLEVALAQFKGGNPDIYVESAGSLATDKITIANTSKTLDVFNDADIDAIGVEELTIDTGSGGTDQEIDDIDVGDTLTSTLKFVGSNTVEVDTIDAGTIDASGLTGDASVSFKTPEKPAAPNASNVFKVIGSKNGDAITLRDGRADIDLGLGDDLLIVRADALDGDKVNGGDGGRDELRIDQGGLDATDLANVTGFEILGFEYGNDTLSQSQDLQQFVYSNMELDTLLFGEDSDWTVTNARAAVETISFIDDGGGNDPDVYTHVVNSIAMDRWQDADGNTSRSASPAGEDAITIETLDVDADLPVQREHKITTLTLNDEEEITIQLGDAVTNASDTYTSDLEIGTLNAIDLTKLNVFGEGDVKITLGAYGAATGLGVTPGIVEVDASGLVRASTFYFDAALNNDTASGSAVQLDITGSLSGNNTIIGGQAADSITGGQGADSLDGGAGSDRIVAGAGSDIILGGAGDDIISGGVGADVMTGGDGVNRFVFVSGDGVAATDTKDVAGVITVEFDNGVDIITDFKSVGNGTAANDAAADIMVWNGVEYAGTVAVFNTELRAGNAAYGDAIADAAGLYWIQGEWDGANDEFKIGTTDPAAVDFMIFSHAGGILDAASLIGVRDIVIHDIT